MTLRSMIWRVLATLFIVLNLVGAAYAAWMGETMHTLAHAALVAATYPVWRIVERRRRATTY